LYSAAPYARGGEHITPIARPYRTASRREHPATSASEPANTPSTIC